MTEEFRERDLAGAAFRGVDLAGASFDHVSFVGARFHDVNLTGVTLRAAFVKDVAVDGEVLSLRLYGIDVVPLVVAELDRLHPERLALRPTDVAGFGEAWTVIEDLWAATVEQARQLAPALLHEQVNGEWSFIETLRHLVFATDAWIGRVVLGDPNPWDPLDLPWDEMSDVEGVPRDRMVRPSLDDVLHLRAERMATVRRVLGGLTDEDLHRSTAPMLAPGWPQTEGYPLSDVLQLVVDEEWWHRQYAERDLAVLRAPVT